LKATFKFFGIWTRLLVLGLVLFFTACAHSAKDRIGTPQNMRQSAIVAWVVGQAPGSRTVIDAPEFGGAVTVKVDSIYYSAAGLPCKRIQVFNGSPLGEPVAVCEKKTGEWVMEPRIWGGAPARGKQ
jgi:hypothetical protein